MKDNYGGNSSCAVHEYGNTSRHWSCHYLCLCLFFGPVFSPHHTNQIDGENHICTVLYISMATVISPTPPGTGLVFVFVFSLSLSGGNCTCTMLYISMTTVLGSTPPGTGLFFVFSLSFPCIFFVFSIYMHRKAVLLESVPTELSNPIQPNPLIAFGHLSLSIVI